MSMTTNRPFRFGVFGGEATADDWIAFARRAEDLGYDVVSTSDHLDLSGAHVARLAAIPALASAATATSRIGIGTAVLNQDMHHPAVLAREVTSLDILSNGRLELGIGAGHTVYEYEWAGLSFDPGPIRVSRFEEYVRIVKRLLTEDEVTDAGEFFQITDMPGAPKTVQIPHPPLMLGGTRRRMLSFAAREADIVSINLYDASEPKTPAAIDTRLGWIREAAGDRLGELEINVPLAVVVVGDGDRRDLLRDVLTDLAASGMDYLTAGMTEDEILASPIVLLGSVEQIADDLLAWRERWGISYVSVIASAMEGFAPVIAQLRET